MSTAPVRAGVRATKEQRGPTGAQRGTAFWCLHRTTNLRVRSSNLFGRATKFLENQAQTGRSEMTGPFAFWGVPPRWPHFAVDRPVRTQDAQFAVHGYSRSRCPRIPHDRHLVGVIPFGPGPLLEGPRRPNTPCYHSVVTSSLSDLVVYPVCASQKAWVNFHALVLPARSFPSPCGQVQRRFPCLPGASKRAVTD